MIADEPWIAHIARGVLDRTLPKAEWTHHAHWALALWLLRHRPDRADPASMREVISGYNLATGTPNTDTGGYHHTITLASLRGAAAMLAADPDQAPLDAVLAALIESPLGRSDWPLAHWRRETLFAVRARRGWVEPDLAPLPF